MIDFSRYAAIAAVARKAATGPVCFPVCAAPFPSREARRWWARAGEEPDHEDGSASAAALTERANVSVLPVSKQDRSMRLCSAFIAFTEFAACTAQVCSRSNHMRGPREAIERISMGPLGFEPRTNGLDVRQQIYLVSSGFPISSGAEISRSRRSCYVRCYEGRGCSAPKG
jgi:hypothetical protein